MSGADPRDHGSGPARDASCDPAPVLRLGAFEGPLDRLLDRVRAGAVDLRPLSILSVVEQSLAAIGAARRTRLERAADWLVTAAWLAWLKSRALLPADDAPEPAAPAGPDASSAAGAAARDHARAAALWLDRRPVLGRDVFGRGAPEPRPVILRETLALDLRSLVRAYLATGRRRAARSRYRPDRRLFWTVDAALAHLRGLLAAGGGWTQLDLFAAAPEAAPEAGPLAVAAARAGTLLAGLELARTGLCELRQDEPFGPLLLRARARAA